MSARFARTAAAVVATLLGLGALVAVVSPDDEGENSSASGAPATEAQDESALKAEGDAYGFGTGAREETTGDDLVAPPAAAPEAAASAAAPAGGETAPKPAATGTVELPPIGPDAAALGGASVPAVVPVAGAPGRIIKNAVLTIDVPKGKLRTSFDRVVMVATEAGGWVQSAEEGDDQASLVVKVPAEGLERVLGQIAEVGKRKSQSIGGEDVSAEFVDLEARLRHWRAQEAVFLGLMAQAKTIPDTIQIQQQLSSIQSQIEQIEGRRRFLDGQTAYSTIRLTLLEAGAVAETEADSDEQSILAEAWDDAAGTTLAVLGGTLVVLAAVVPLALIVGLPALVFLAYRRRQQRTRPEVLPVS